MKLAWVMALAGCGQIASQELVVATGDGEVARENPDKMVTLVVTSPDSRKVPISGATVLIDRGTGGDLDRTATDDTGVALFPAAGVVACHVIYQNDDESWQAYTINVCRAGTIKLGGVDAVPATRKAMTFSLPVASDATSYRIVGPLLCGPWDEVDAPVFTAPYTHACEGKTVHLFACASGTAGDQCFDAGYVTLTDGTTQVVTGAYQAPLPAEVQLTNLPVDLRSAQVTLLARSADAVTELPEGTSSVLAPGTTTTVPVGVVPGGNLLRVSGTREQGPRNPFRTTTELVAPATAEAVTSIDAQALLTPFFSLSSSGLSLSWDGGGVGGTILTIQATSDFSGPRVFWSAYLEPSASSVTFPALPDDLVDATPSRWSFAAVTKLDVPGATAESLVRTIDRIWPQWPDNVTLLPPEGGRKVQASAGF
ncbi:MAG TPA: hypothetical protein VF469_25835 [Kofleriaceae bacterium]